MVMLTFKMPLIGVLAISAWMRTVPGDWALRVIWLNGIPVLPAAPRIPTYELSDTVISKECKAPSYICGVKPETANGAHVLLEPGGRSWAVSTSAEAWSGITEVTIIKKVKTTDKPRTRPDRG
jgi:hypothetical protein